MGLKIYNTLTRTKEPLVAKKERPGITTPAD